MLAAALALYAGVAADVVNAGRLSAMDLDVAIVHYATDVLGGAFLGLAWLSACLLVALRLRR